MIILKIFDDPSMNNYNDNDEDDYNDNIAGIPWTLHSWIRTLLTAQLGGLTNILDELLQVWDMYRIYLLILQGFFNFVQNAFDPYPPFVLKTW